MVGAGVFVELVVSVLAEDEVLHLAIQELEE